MYEDDDGDHHPAWPAATYMIKCVDDIPLEVTNFCESQLSTRNRWARSGILDVALALPAEHARRLAPGIASWLIEPDSRIFEENVIRLGEQLAEHGQIDSALTILDTALTFAAPTQEDEQPVRHWGIETALDSYWTEKFLRRLGDSLQSTEPIALLRLLSAKIAAMAEAASDDQNTENKEDHSAFWCSDLSSPHGYDDRAPLIAAFFATASVHARRSVLAAGQVLEIVRQSEWTVFKRVELVLLAQLVDSHLDTARARVFDRRLFDNSYVREEYVVCLRSVFPRLSGREQEELWTWIDAGPSREWLREHGPPEEEFTRYAARWRRDRYHWLESILDGGRRSEYEQLRAEFGPPDQHALTPHALYSYDGPTSPLGSEELSSMSIDQIIQFLNHWVPSEGVWQDDASRRLAGELTKATTEQSERFFLELERFHAVPPKYARAVLSGLNKAARDEGGSPESWDSMFGMMEHLVLLTEDNEVGEPDIRWIRSTILDVLNGRLAVEEMQPDEFDRTWTILELLCEDSDPSPARDSDGGNHNVAINSIRGRALELVRPFLHKLHFPKEGGRPPGEPRSWVQDSSEVRALLERHLDPYRDPSLAIRSVYGVHLSFFYQADREWTLAVMDNIFPKDVELATFRGAAWSAYIRWCRPLLPIENIRDEYLNFFSSPGSQSASEDIILNATIHVVQYYERGEICIEDPLFDLIRDRVPAQLLVRVLGNAGYRAEKNGLPTQRDTLEALWERFVTRHMDDDVPPEQLPMGALATWSKLDIFPISWTLEQFAMVLRKHPRINIGYYMSPLLVRFAAENPPLTLECIGRLCDPVTSYGDIYSWREGIIAALAHLLRVDDEAVVAKAEDLVNTMLSLGDASVGDLLEPNAPRAK